LNSVYLDTSVVVASLVHEPGTATAHNFLEGAMERPWLISSWLETELASALAMQWRRGTLEAEERDQAWKRFQELREAKLRVLQLEAPDFETATRLCLEETATLRAGDALHLAVCMRCRAQLVSFDEAFCAAASNHRVGVELLRSSH
jgi:predicted nucleic acid-binding protein